LSADKQTPLRQLNVAEEKITSIFSPAVKGNSLRLRKVRGIIFVLYLSVNHDTEFGINKTWVWKLFCFLKLIIV